eukprot:3799413-Rhodomonas_salina.1
MLLKVGVWQMRMPSPSRSPPPSSHPRFLFSPLPSILLLPAALYGAPAWSAIKSCSCSCSSPPHDARAFGIEEAAHTMGDPT